MPRDPKRTAPKRSSKRRKSNTILYPVKFDRKERHLNHPHKGKVEVVTLFCNCGRSVFIDADEIDQIDVICGRCNGTFQWQQLSFGDLNAA